jgi:hypothetical protein
MNNARDAQIRAWVLVGGILLIVGFFTLAFILLLRASFQRVQQAVAPVNEVTNGLSTQIALVLHPTPTVVPDPVTVINQVRSLARLETIQYSVEKVISAENGQGALAILFGDKLLFVAHGVVIAGIDLEKLGPKDMWVEDNVLYVRLPEPELFIATLDNDKSYVYDRTTGLLTHGDVNLETTARRAAEAEIEKAAIEDGILEQAGKNAESFMYRLLRDLGYPEVIFVKPEPTPVP